MSYEVNQVRLDGVPKIPYADGIGKHRGVCMHATANYGAGEAEDTAMSERNWEQGHWQDAFVHYFCDYQTILDVADDDYVSWGCGGGNKYFINIELCQTKRTDRFIESYHRWCWIAAKVLHDNQLGVVDGKSIVSHKWVSENIGGTHTDPHEYLASHGYTWDNVLQDVLKYYNEFDSATTQPKGDDENMPMNLSDDEWKRLNNIYGQRYNKGEFTDWKWMQKIRSKTLTVTELTFLDSMLRARKDGYSTEPNSYGM